MYDVGCLMGGVECMMYGVDPYHQVGASPNSSMYVCMLGPRSHLRSGFCDTQSPSCMGFLVFRMLNVVSKKAGIVHVVFFTYLYALCVLQTACLRSSRNGIACLPT